jgi:hypothetical protein
MDPTELEELVRLRAENARLIALLKAHDINWRPVQKTSEPPNLESESAALSAADEVSLFRRLFRGRTDVYAVRWESATTDKSGYAPACANEWRPTVCEKPRIKCRTAAIGSCFPYRTKLSTATSLPKRRLGSIRS